MKEQPTEDVKQNILTESCLFNSKQPDKDTEPISQEELKNFIQRIKHAFIEAVDSLDSKEFSESDFDKMLLDCTLRNVEDEEKNVIKNPFETETAVKSSITDKQEAGTECDNDTILEYVDGKIKVNIPKDPETRKLWKFLRKAMDQGVIDKNQTNSNKNDVLGVDKYGDDYEAFFESLMKK
ncbi:hypothetical protein CDIK_0348 [Cucumispora dikerogammari]|nr:hypothetical protein CDIK_0348 [Cucumispora dikerogammari]